MCVAFQGAFEVCHNDGRAASGKAAAMPLNGKGGWGNEAHNANE
jgi:hypothetical protein